jgi:hypothetical protein
MYLIGTYVTFQPLIPPDRNWADYVVRNRESPRSIGGSVAPPLFNYWFRWEI